MKPLLLHAIFAAAAVAISVHAAPELRNDAGRLSVNGAPLRLTLGGAAPDFPGSLPEPQITREGDALVRRVSTPRFDWTTRFTTVGKLIAADSEFRNKTGGEMKIEPGMSLTVPLAGELEFWDGFGKVRPVGGETLSRNGIKGALLKHIGSASIPFPAVAVANGESGYFLGHGMFAPVSYSAVRYQPATKELDFVQRYVVALGETLRFRQTVGSASARYGAAEGVVQSYYESTPDAWAVAEGQDNPYIWGNLAHYENWWGEPDEELSRRFRTSIEWCYCPYKRSGDIAVRPELWEYKPYNGYRANQTPKFGGKKVDFTKISRDEFLKLRRERFLLHGRKYGWMFYNSCAGTWCEYELAHSRYPDAINYDKTVSHILNAWSTGHDREIRVFPMETSFAKVLEEDMTQLAAELDLPGFALDCGSGGVFYRGPACAKPLPGRAWDAEGVFIDQGVAVNHLTDFIHSIKTPSGKPLTVFINGSLKGDLVMVEKSYLNAAEFKGMMPLHRWYIGPRPGVVHGHGYMLRDLVPDWRNKSEAEFRELMPRLSDYIILNQFKYALTNSYVTFYGNPQQLYIQPEALELMRAGWQATVPLTLSPELYAPYRSRYGRAEHTFVYLGNSGKETTRGSVAVDNAELGGEHYLLLRKLRSKAKTDNRIDGRFTRIDAELPSRTPVLFETVCGLTAAPASLRAAVTGAKALNEQTFSVTFTESPDFESALALRRIRNFTLKSVLLDGKAVAFRPDKDRYLTPPLQLRPGARLTFRYESDQFRSPERAITAFPFTDSADQLSFKIQLDPADKAARRVAGRFERYFAFCRKHKMLKPGENRPSLTLDPEARGRGDVLSLAVRPGAPAGIAVAPGGGLLLEAGSEEALEQLVVELLYVMDKRYVCNFPFSRSMMGLYDDQLRHFNMMGRFFPIRPYFD